MLKRLYYFLCGYVTVRVWGGYGERFLNLCSGKNIKLWKLKRNRKYFEFSMKAAQVKSLKPLLKKTGMRLKILKKAGLPFLLHRYRKRKAFFVGFLGFFAVIYGLSLFLWNIEILGNYRYSSEFLMKYFVSEGYCIGRRLSDIDCNSLEQQMRKDYSDIGWVSAEIKGARLIVKVQETNKTAEGKTEGEPSHLASSVTGKVVSIITRKGTPQVKMGDEVNPDDVLISGVVNIIGDNETEVGTELVEADGDVYIETSVRYFDHFPMDHTVKQFTGKKKYALRITAWNQHLWIPLFVNPYESCDIVTDYKNVPEEFKNLFPVGLSVSKYREYTEETVHYTEEEARSLAEKRLDLYLQKLIEKGVSIIKNNVKIVMDETTCIAEGEVIVQEKMEKRKVIAADEYHRDLD
ncbi:sporulation protein YqfD [Anaerolentibacter hominis]|uniref:sporulation protein YqfD n=1 Tax=Anaerolentibacter hominis TaxID=3079009 RepID=UPI0031B89B55